MSDPMVIANSDGKKVFSVYPTGMVVLEPDIDLANVKGMDLEYLLFVREVVNTAIYDKERGR